MTAPWWVGATQPSLEQGDYEMDMVESPTRSFAPCADYMRVVIESGDVELVVDLQAVSDNPCADFDIVLNKRFDGIPVNRRDATKTNPSKFSLCFSFYSDKNQCFPLCSSSACSFFLSTDIGFVHFDTASQMFPTSSYHDTPKLLQPTPSSLIAPETVRVAKILGTQTCLLSHHEPHYVKPQTQRLATTFKNCPSRHRTLPPASLAMPQSTVCAPCLSAATFRADKTIWPSNPLQIRCTVFLYRKPVKKFLERPRIRDVNRRFHTTNTTSWGHLSQSATQLKL